MCEFKDIFLASIKVLKSLWCEEFLLPQRVVALLVRLRVNSLHMLKGAKKMSWKEVPHPLKNKWQPPHIVSIDCFCWLSKKSCSYFLQSIIMIVIQNATLTVFNLLQWAQSKILASSYAHKMPVLLSLIFLWETKKKKKTQWLPMHLLQKEKKICYYFSHCYSLSIIYLYFFTI